MFGLVAKKTGVKEVEEYWASTLVDMGICDVEDNLSGCCWRCKSSFAVSACQIVNKIWPLSYSLSNKIVLCQSCQIEKPLVKNPDLVWNWLENESGQLFWAKQGMSEYERRYEKSVLQELWDMGIRNSSEVESLVERVLKSVRINCQIINQSTLANVFRSEIILMQKEMMENFEENNGYAS
ncbi:TPA: hypothetical protein TXL48_000115 [Streptococcus suis]|nr:hypothetical protein [Streptococcus suis]